MNEYQSVYNLLNLPRRAVEYATGRSPLVIPKLLERVHQPAGYYGFPPAFIPLWSVSEYPTYYGCWKHWFTDSRSLSYVRIPLEEGYRPFEIARTFDQLLTYLVYEETRIDEIIDDAVVRFADAECVDSFAEIASIASQVPLEVEHPEMLTRLKAFRDNPPLFCYEDGRGYCGDFPNPSMELTDATARSICGLELDEELFERVKALGSTPPWLTRLRWKCSDIEAIFSDCLTKSDLLGAWMSLNSSGWNSVRARDSLEKLSLVANDCEFDVLVKAWKKAYIQFFQDVW